MSAFETLVRHAVFASVVTLAGCPLDVPVFAGGPDDLVTPVITFDMPPTVAAVPLESHSQPISPTAGQWMGVEMRLSSMIATPAMPDIERWMIRCVPRNPSWRVIDYSPGTEVASDYASPIQVQSNDESSHSSGVSVDGAYGHLVNGHIGGDRGGKKSMGIKYDRHAPVHAVTAAGTIERGRGVYFKLRWTSTQVLEGEKRFAITFEVPPSFRGGLIDVSVVAHGSGASAPAWSELPGLGPREAASVVLGRADFVIAVYRDGDGEAWQLARDLSLAEASLRSTAVRASSPQAIRSIPTLVRHVAAKFNLDETPPDTTWVNRLLAGNADPYVDPVIRKLPTEVRVRTLDYVDLRRKLVQLQPTAPYELAMKNWESAGESQPD